MTLINRSLIHRAPRLGRVVRFFAGTPWIFDITLITGLALWYVPLVAGQARPLTVALGCLQMLPLTWRRSRPWPVLGAVAAAALVTRWIGQDPAVPQAAFFLGIAVYAAGRWTRPQGACRRGAAAVAFATTVMAAPELLGRWHVLPIAHPSTITSVDMSTFLMIFTGAWVLGHQQRCIRADADQLRDAATRLRAERETNARNAVLTERFRIARDLHDVVAHHVSAIAVQAQSVTDLIEDIPRQMADEIVQIGESADTALSEMRRMLGILAGGPQMFPEPSLSHLDPLLRTAEAAGCRVSVAGGTGEHLPPAVDVSAYRVVQEALTNVIRHAGPTDVRIELHATATMLRVLIINGVPVPPRRHTADAGLGLAGMRERVTVFDGTLDAGPTVSGGWRIAATFPLGAKR